jgi:hypothetical protein
VFVLVVAQPHGHFAVWQCHLFHNLGNAPATLEGLY